jgi:hypothetical protein
MIRGNSYRIDSYVDSGIKVGNIVRMVDGSGLSLVCDYDTIEWSQDYVIVSAYPELTGLDKILKDCNAKVLETGLSSHCRIGVCGHVYVQDILVEIGKAKFRTCSAFVENLN